MTDYFGAGFGKQGRGRGQKRTEVTDRRWQTAGTGEGAVAGGSRN